MGVGLNDLKCGRGLQSKKLLITVNWIIFYIPELHTNRGRNDKQSLKRQNTKNLQIWSVGVMVDISGFLKIFFTRINLPFSNLGFGHSTVHSPWRNTLVFHDTHFYQIIWQIWSYTAQNGFRQKLFPVGFEPTTSWSSVSCSANWARKESVGDFWSELSFVSCTTTHVGLCLFLKSIEHEFIKGLMIHTHNQIVT